jgi:hypothetical protein
MLSRLQDEALARGVTRLRAMVQADNFAMRALLYHVCPDTRIDRCDGSEVEYRAAVKPVVPIAEAA